MDYVIWPFIVTSADDAWVYIQFVFIYGVRSYLMHRKGLFLTAAERVRFKALLLKPLQLLKLPLFFRCEGGAAHRR